MGKRGNGQEEAASFGVVQSVFPSPPTPRKPPLPLTSALPR